MLLTTHTSWSSPVDGVEWPNFSWMLVLNFHESHWNLLAFWDFLNFPNRMRHQHCRFLPWTEWCIMDCARHTYTDHTSMQYVCAEHCYLALSTWNGIRDDLQLGSNSQLCVLLGLKLDVFWFTGCCAFWWARCEFFQKSTSHLQHVLPGNS